MRKTDYISFFKYLLCIYNTGFSEEMIIVLQKTDYILFIIYLLCLWHVIDIINDSELNMIWFML